MWKLWPMINQTGKAQMLIEIHDLLNFWINRKILFSCWLLILSLFLNWTKAVLLTLIDRLIVNWLGILKVTGPKRLKSFSSWMGDYVRYLVLLKYLVFYCVACIPLQLISDALTEPENLIYSKIENMSKNLLLLQVNKNIWEMLNIIIYRPSYFINKIFERNSLFNFEECWGFHSLEVMGFSVSANEVVRHFSNW